MMAWFLETFRVSARLRNELLYQIAKVLERQIALFAMKVYEYIPTYLLDSITRKTNKTLTELNYP